MKSFTSARNADGEYQWDTKGSSGARTAAILQAYDTEVARQKEIYRAEFTPDPLSKLSKQEQFEDYWERVGKGEVTSRLKQNAQYALEQGDPD